MKYALLILLALTLPVAAGEPRFVVSYTSEPDESMDAFVMRIARDAVRRSMSRDVSSEICGEFSRTEGRLTVDMYTINRIRACSYYREPDRDYTGLSFHTHVTLSGPTPAAKFSEEDYEHPGYMVQERTVMFQNGRGSERRLR